MSRADETSETPQSTNHIDAHNTTSVPDPTETQALTTPPMQRLDVEFQVGESIQYWSHTYELWMNAVVQQQNPDPETGVVVSYDLDVKSGAKPMNMRRLSEDSSRLVPAGPSMAQPKQNAQYRVGQHVEYWSGTHYKWVQATVKAVHDGETYDLDVKRGALRKKIRPLSTHPTGCPLSTMQPAFSSLGAEMGTRSGFMPTLGELAADASELNGSDAAAEVHHDTSVNNQMGLVVPESDTAQGAVECNHEVPVGNRTMGLVPVEADINHGNVETTSMGLVDADGQLSSNGLDSSTPVRSTNGTDTSSLQPTPQGDQEQEMTYGNVNIKAAAEISFEHPQASGERRAPASILAGSVDKQTTPWIAGQLCTMVAEMSSMIIAGDAAINQRWLMRFSEVHRKYVELAQELNLKDSGLAAKLGDSQLDFGFWGETGSCLPSRVDRIDERSEDMSKLNGTTLP
eukprot:gnl/MRDRNA2_/MRDRNA2_35295_c0_seq1.p1 gnl/MRDRNA2_/MRDRNA2_35295_c0~~gnl/MRDRNA2_/MRDRNA2_35295_c0_seq1.p1  ORF type:complete len:457 (-),score=94.96 gnl/MRDRNA2_/MRDRNA2_35295_c0_seq1:59-1429(-)